MPAHPPLHVRHQPAVRLGDLLQLRQHHIGRDRRAVEVPVATQGVGNRTQHRGRTCADRRLADTLGADRIEWVRYVGGDPPHRFLVRHVQDARGTVVVEPLGDRESPAAVEHPFLAQRHSDALDCTGVNLRPEQPRVHDRATVSAAEVVHERDLSGLHVDLHLRKPDNEGHHPTTGRERVLGDTHQAAARQRRGRRDGHPVDVIRQLVPVEAPAQRDGPFGRPRETDPLRPGAPLEHPLAGDVVIVW